MPKAIDDYDAAWGKHLSHGDCFVRVWQSSELPDGGGILPIHGVERSARW
jgi:hypothetical protein